MEECFGFECLCADEPEELIRQALGEKLYSQIQSHTVPPQSERPLSIEKSLGEKSEKLSEEEAEGSNLPGGNTVDSHGHDLLSVVDRNHESQYENITLSRYDRSSHGGVMPSSHKIEKVGDGFKFRFSRVFPSDPFQGVQGNPGVSIKSAISSTVGRTITDQSLKSDCGATYCLEMTDSKSSSIPSYSVTSVPACMTSVTVSLGQRVCLQEDGIYMVTKEDHVTGKKMLTKSAVNTLIEPVKEENAMDVFKFDSDYSDVLENMDRHSYVGSKVGKQTYERVPIHNRDIMAHAGKGSTLMEQIQEKRKFDMKRKLEKSPGNLAVAPKVNHERKSEGQVSEIKDSEVKVSEHKTRMDVEVKPLQTESQIEFRSVRENKIEKSLPLVSPSRKSNRVWKMKICRCGCMGLHELPKYFKSTVKSGHEGTTDKAKWEKSEKGLLTDKSVKINDRQKALNESSGQQKGTKKKRQVVDLNPPRKVGSGKVQSKKLLLKTSSDKLKQNSNERRRIKANKRDQTGSRRRSKDTAKVACIGSDSTSSQESIQKKNLAYSSSVGKTVRKNKVVPEEGEPIIDKNEEVDGDTLALNAGNIDMDRDTKVTLMGCESAESLFSLGQSDFSISYGAQKEPDSESSAKGDLLMDADKPESAGGIDAKQRLKENSCDIATELEKQVQEIAMNMPLKTEEVIERRKLAPGSDLAKKTGQKKQQFQVKYVKLERLNPNIQAKQKELTASDGSNMQFKSGDKADYRSTNVIEGARSVEQQVSSVPVKTVTPSRSVDQDALKETIIPDYNSSSARSFTPLRKYWSAKGPRIVARALSPVTRRQSSEEKEYIQTQNLVHKVHSSGSQDKAKVSESSLIHDAHDQSPVSALEKLRLKLFSQAGIIPESKSPHHLGKRKNWSKECAEQSTICSSKGKKIYSVSEKNEIWDNISAVSGREYRKEKNIKHISNSNYDLPNSSGSVTVLSVNLVRDEEAFTQDQVNATGETRDLRKRDGEYVKKKMIPLRNWDKGKSVKCMAGGKQSESSKKGMASEKMKEDSKRSDSPVDTAHGNVFKRTLDLTPKGLAEREISKQEVEMTLKQAEQSGASKENGKRKEEGNTTEREKNYEFKGKKIKEIETPVKKGEMQSTTNKQNKTATEASRVLVKEREQQEITMIKMDSLEKIELDAKARQSAVECKMACLSLKKKTEPESKQKKCKMEFQMADLSLKSVRDKSSKSESKSQQVVKHKGIKYKMADLSMKKTPHFKTKGRKPEMKYKMVDRSLKKGKHLDKKAMSGKPGLNSGQKIASSRKTLQKKRKLQEALVPVKVKKLKHCENRGKGSSNINANADKVKKSRKRYAVVPKKIVKKRRLSDDEAKSETSSIVNGRHLSKSERGTKAKADVNDNEQKKVVPKMKPRKCHSCENIFKSNEHFKKHLPCRSRPTRNWCQKVLRPNRVFTPKDAVPGKKTISTIKCLKLSGKYRSERPRPNMLSSAKKPSRLKVVRGKARKKLLYAIRETMGKRKPHIHPHQRIDVLSLPEKELYFFHLGMISFDREGTLRMEILAEEERMATLSKEAVEEEADLALSESSSVSSETTDRTQSVLSLGGEDLDNLPPILEKVYISDEDDILPEVESGQPEKKLHRLEPPVLEPVPQVRKSKRLKNSKETSRDGQSLYLECIERGHMGGHFLDIMDKFGDAPVSGVSDSSVFNQDAVEGPGAKPQTASHSPIIDIALRRDFKITKDKFSKLKDLTKNIVTPSSPLKSATLSSHLEDVVADAPAEDAAFLSPQDLLQKHTSSGGVTLAHIKGILNPKDTKWKKYTKESLMKLSSDLSALLARVKTSQGDSTTFSRFSARNIPTSREKSNSERRNLFEVLTNPERDNRKVNQSTSILEVDKRYITFHSNSKGLESQLIGSTLKNYSSSSDFGFVDGLSDKASGVANSEQSFQCEDGVVTTDQLYVESSKQPCAAEEVTVGVCEAEDGSASRQSITGNILSMLSILGDRGVLEENMTNIIQMLAKNLGCQSSRKNSCIVPKSDTERSPEHNPGLPESETDTITSNTSLQDVTFDSASLSSEQEIQQIYLEEEDLEAEQVSSNSEFSSENPVSHALVSACNDSVKTDLNTPQKELTKQHPGTPDSSSSKESGEFSVGPSRDVDVVRPRNDNTTESVSWELDSGGLYKDQLFSSDSGNRVSLFSSNLKHRREETDASQFCLDDSQQHAAVVSSVNDIQDYRLRTCDSFSLADNTDVDKQEHNFDSLVSKAENEFDSAQSDLSCDSEVDHFQQIINICQSIENSDKVAPGEVSLKLDESEGHETELSRCPENAESEMYTLHEATAGLPGGRSIRLEVVQLSKSSEKNSVASFDKSGSVSEVSVAIAGSDDMGARNCNQAYESSEIGSSVTDRDKEHTVSVRDDPVSVGMMSSRYEGLGPTPYPDGETIMCNANSDEAAYIQSKDEVKGSCTGQQVYSDISDAEDEDCKPVNPLQHPLHGIFGSCLLGTKYSNNLLDCKQTETIEKATEEKLQVRNDSNEGLQPCPSGLAAAKMDVHVQIEGPERSEGAYGSTSGTASHEIRAVNEAIAINNNIPNEAKDTESVEEKREEFLQGSESDEDLDDIAAFPDRDGRPSLDGISEELKSGPKDGIECQSAELSVAGSESYKSREESDSQSSTQSSADESEEECSGTRAFRTFKKEGPTIARTSAVVDVEDDQANYIMARVMQDDTLTENQVCIEEVNKEEITCSKDCAAKVGGVGPSVDEVSSDLCVGSGVENGAGSHFTQVCMHHASTSSLKDTGRMEIDKGYKENTLASNFVTKCGKAAVVSEMKEEMFNQQDEGQGSHKMSRRAQVIDKMQGIVKVAQHCSQEVTAKIDNAEVVLEVLQQMLETVTFQNEQNKNSLCHMYNSRVSDQREGAFQPRGFEQKVNTDSTTSVDGSSGYENKIDHGQRVPLPFRNKDGKPDLILSECSSSGDENGIGESALNGMNTCVREEQEIACDNDEEIPSPIFPEVGYSPTEACLDSDDSEIHPDPGFKFTEVSFRERNPQISLEIITDSVPVVRQNFNSPEKIDDNIEEAKEDTIPLESCRNPLNQDCDSVAGSQESISHYQVTEVNSCASSPACVKAIDKINTSSHGGEHVGSHWCAPQDPGVRGRDSNSDASPDSFPVVSAENSLGQESVVSLYSEVQGDSSSDITKVVRQEFSLEPEPQLQMKDNAVLEYTCSQILDSKLVEGLESEISQDSNAAISGDPVYTNHQDCHPEYKQDSKINKRQRSERLKASPDLMFKYNLPTKVASNPSSEVFCQDSKSEVLPESLSGVSYHRNPEVDQNSDIILGQSINAKTLQKSKLEASQDRSLSHSHELSPELVPEVSQNKMHHVGLIQDEVVEKSSEKISLELQSECADEDVEKTNEAIDLNSGPDISQDKVLELDANQNGEICKGSEKDLQTDGTLNENHDQTIEVDEEFGYEIDNKLLEDVKHDETEGSEDAEICEEYRTIEKSNFESEQDVCKDDPEAVELDQNNETGWEADKNNGLESVVEISQDDVDQNAEVSGDTEENISHGINADAVWDFGLNPDGCEVKKLGHVPLTDICQNNSVEDHLHKDAELGFETIEDQSYNSAPEMEQSKKLEVVVDPGNVDGEEACEGTSSELVVSQNINVLNPDDNLVQESYKDSFCEVSQNCTVEFDQDPDAMRDNGSSAEISQDFRTALNHVSIPAVSQIVSAEVSLDNDSGISHSFANEVSQNAKICEDTCPEIHQDRETKDSQDFYYKISQDQGDTFSIEICSDDKPANCIPASLNDPENAISAQEVDEDSGRTLIEITADKDSRSSASPLREDAKYQIQYKCGDAHTDGSVVTVHSSAAGFDDLDTVLREDASLQGRSKCNEAPTDGSVVPGHSSTSGVGNLDFIPGKGANINGQVLNKWDDAHMDGFEVKFYGSTAGVDDSYAVTGEDANSQSPSKWDDAHMDASEVKFYGSTAGVDDSYSITEEEANSQGPRCDDAHTVGSVEIFNRPLTGVGHSDSIKEEGANLQGPNKCNDAHTVSFEDIFSSSITADSTEGEHANLQGPYNSNDTHTVGSVDIFSSSITADSTEEEHATLQGSNKCDDAHTVGSVNIFSSRITADSTEEEHATLQGSNKCDDAHTVGSVDIFSSSITGVSHFGFMKEEGAHSQVKNKIDDADKVYSVDLCRNIADSDYTKGKIASSQVQKKCDNTYKDGSVDILTGCTSEDGDIDSTESEGADLYVPNKCDNTPTDGCVDILNSSAIKIADLEPDSAAFSLSVTSQETSRQHTGQSMCRQPSSQHQDRDISENYPVSNDMGGNDSFPGKGPCQSKSNIQLEDAEVLTGLNQRDCSVVDCCESAVPKVDDRTDLIDETDKTKYSAAVIERSEAMIQGSRKVPVLQDLNKFAESLSDSDELTAGQDFNEASDVREDGIKGEKQDHLSYLNQAEESSLASQNEQAVQVNDTLTLIVDTIAQNSDDRKFSTGQCIEEFDRNKPAEQKDENKNTQSAVEGDNCRLESLVKESGVYVKSLEIDSTSLQNVDTAGDKHRVIMDLSVIKSELCMARSDIEIGVSSCSNFTHSRDNSNSLPVKCQAVEHNKTTQEEDYSSNTCVKFEDDKHSSATQKEDNSMNTYASECCRTTQNEDSSSSTYVKYEANDEYSETVLDEDNSSNTCVNFEASEHSKTKQVGDNTSNICVNCEASEHSKTKQVGDNTSNICVNFEASEHSKTKQVGDNTSNISVNCEASEHSRSAEDEDNSSSTFSKFEASEHSS